MKLALLVGINDYPGTQLHGCINDATRMESFLRTRCGFTADECTPLLDATRDDIISALKSASKAASQDPGSLVVFYYSGHGYADMFLKGPRVPADGVYSMLCPIDWGSDKMSAIISVDFEKAIQPLRDSGTQFIGIFDACMSGSLGPFVVGRRKSPKPLTISLDDLAHAQPLLEIYDGATSLTACATNETTLDLDHLPSGAGPGGAYTWALLSALTTPKASMQVEHVIDTVHNTLTQHGFKQTPQILPPDAGSLPFPTSQ